MGILAKAPDADLDYGIDWQAYLQAGETLASSDWDIVPEETSGLSAAATRLTETETAVRLIGGRAGHGYRIANRVTTSAGRTDVRSLFIQVQTR